MTLADVLQFPDSLRITLRDANTSEPISKIAVTLVVFTKRRNNYYLGLPLSDSNGNTEITKTWVENAIGYLRNTFIMDYSSTLKECLPKIMLDIMSSEQIARAKTAMKLHGAERGGLDIAYTISDLEITNNKYFEQQKVYVTLDAVGAPNKSIEINLRKLG